MITDSRRYSYVKSMFYQHLVDHEVSKKSGIARGFLGCGSSNVTGEGVNYILKISIMTPMVSLRLRENDAPYRRRRFR